MISKLTSIHRFIPVAVFCLLPAWAAAQEKHLTSDFNLTKDVVKLETAVYQVKGGNSQHEKSKTLEFKDAKLVRRVVKYTEVTRMIYGDDETFVYDTSGNLTKIESKVRYPSNYTYDAKGRLSKIKQGDRVFVEDFTYDSKGKPIKVVKKNGDFVDSEMSYQDYKDPLNHSYKLLCYAHQKKELKSTEIAQMIQGRKMTSRTTYAPDGKVKSARYIYDEHGNLTRTEFSGGEVVETFFGYDAKGNAIKERSGEIGDSTYQFSKVTYQDGSSSGSTDFTPYFSSGLQMPLLLMPMNQNPKARFEVKKTGAKDYEVRNAKDQQLSHKPSEGLILEGRDFMFYDANTKEVSVLFGLFSNEYKPGQWYPMTTYNSPTGKYIVVNQDWDFFILEKGKAADSAGLKLHKGIDGNTLVVAENGREKFFVPHMAQMKPFIMYPLEAIAR